MQDLASLTYLIIDEFLKADIAIAADERHYLDKRGFSKLTLNEIRLLGLIQRTPEPTMSLLAKTLGITMGTLTSVVSRLERRGYLLRERQEHDRRVIFVKLLPEGETAANAYTDFFRERVKVAQKHFTSEEVETILKYFRYQYTK